MNAKRDSGDEQLEPSPMTPIGSKATEDVRLSSARALLLIRSVPELGAMRKDADEKEARIIWVSLVRFAVMAGVLGVLVGLFDLASPYFVVLAGFLVSGITIGTGSISVLQKLTSVEQELREKRQAVLQLHE